MSSAEELQLTYFEKFQWLTTVFSFLVLSAYTWHEREWIKKTNTFHSKRYVLHLHNICTRFFFANIFIRVTCFWWNPKSYRLCGKTAHRHTLRIFILLCGVIPLLYSVHIHIWIRLFCAKEMQNKFCSFHQDFNHITRIFQWLIHYYLNRIGRLKAYE